MEILFLILSVLLNIVLIYVCRNLYNKNIAYEEIIITMNDRITQAVRNMRAIDSRGAFEADDEVGSTFKSLLQIVNELGELINVEKEEER